MLHHFNEEPEFMKKYLSVTQSAIRLYDQRNTYEVFSGNPEYTIPLSAIKDVYIGGDIGDANAVFDWTPLDLDFDQNTIDNAANIFAVKLYDEFLPVYLHPMYGNKGINWEDVEEVPIDDATIKTAEMYVNLET